MNSPRKLSKTGSVRTSTGTKLPPSTATKKNDGSNEIKIGKDSNRVKVFVRVRPFSKDEKQRKVEKTPFRISNDGSQLTILPDEKGHGEKNFTFDHLFPMNKTNKEVSDTLTQPLVQSAMNGFNGTLMAYGQTGAGKTFSLMGEQGITKTLIDKCFTQIYDDLKHNYKVTVSYLQIYQEKIFDLLSSTNANNKTPDLTIRENPRTGVYVDNLTDYVVRSPAEVLQYIANGKKKLVFAETKMNRMSSRSHAVLQMVIERTMKEEFADVSDENDAQGSIESQSNADSKENELDLNAFGKDVIIRGKIHICDLAGSERIKRTGASGDRLNEAQHINSSLLELGNVIQALADHSKTHVPFRNSVLTRLLQESLGGNCKTSLIVCVSPSVRDLQETKCTLNFGSRAMKVTNTAYINMEVDFKSLSDQLLKQLQAKEDEIVTIRKNINQELEIERCKAREEAERAHEETKAELEMQQKSQQEEIKNLKEQICFLESEAEMQTNEIHALEESVCSLDDISKRDQLLMVEMLKAEEQFKNFDDQLTISKALRKLNGLKQALTNCAVPKIPSVCDAINLLVSIKNNMENGHTDENEEVFTDTSVEQFNERMRELNNNLKTRYVGDLATHEDFYTSLITVFLVNRIQQMDKETQYQLGTHSSQDELARLKEENAVLISQTRDFQVNKPKNASARMASDDGALKVDKETQATQENISISQKNMLEQTDQLKISSDCNESIQDNMFISQKTTQENLSDQEPNNQSKMSSDYQECTQGKSTICTALNNETTGLTNGPVQVISTDKIDAAIQASYETSNSGSQTKSQEKKEDLKNAVKPDIPTLDVGGGGETNDVKVGLSKRSSEIFSGFNSTLNRIEDMVKSDRMPRTPSYSGASFSHGDDSYRSSSSIGYRSDDSFRASSSLSHRVDDNFRPSSSLSHRVDDNFRPSSSMGIRGENSYRSNSSLGNRFEDSLYSSKRSSPYTTSFLENAGKTDDFDSKYSSKSYTTSQLSSFSKYDLSRSYGGVGIGGSSSARDSLKRFNSIDIDNTTPSNISPKENTSKSGREDRVKELLGQIKDLEKSLKDVQQENQEYFSLVQELSNIAPNNDHLKEFRQKLKTLQSSERRRDSKQIAHIKPFSNSFDVPPTPQVNANTLSISSAASSNDLIEFSPDVERQATTLRSVASIKSNSDESSDSVSQSMTSKQTDAQIGGICNVQMDANQNKRTLTKQRDMTSYLDHDVTFSSDKSPSLALPTLPVG